MRERAIYASIAIVLTAIFVLGSMAGADGSSTSYGPVSVTGPSAVAINSTFNYTVNVQQIFSNYSVVMILSGYNLTGASPVSPVYKTGEQSGSNTFSLRAPSVATTLFILFQVIGNMTNHAKYYYNLTAKVLVKQFTILKATIKNPTEFSISAINVTFKVNGKYAGSELVNLSKNSTKNLTYKWVSGQLPAGVYTVSIYVNSSVVKLEGGNSYTFQIQSGNPYVIYIYIGILAFFTIIVVVLFIASYYARKRRPKWKK